MAFSMFGLVVRWSGMRKRHISSSAFRVPSRKALMWSCFLKESLLTRPKTWPGSRCCQRVWWKPSRSRKCFKSFRNSGGILMDLVAKTEHAPLKADLCFSDYGKTSFKSIAT